MIEIFVFVEGQTERLFIDKILQKYYASNDIHIPIFNHPARNSYIKNENEKLRKIYANPLKPKCCFFIYDCEGVSSIPSKMSEILNKLPTWRNFNYVITLRDLSKALGKTKISTKTHAEILEAINKIKIRILHKDGYNYKWIDRTAHFFAVMEIEAWFLKEYSFLIKINNSLTQDNIKQKLKINLLNDDVELYPKPSKTLDDIYNLANLKYDKNKDEVIKIISMIDYKSLFTYVRKNMPHLHNFLEFIDNCNCSKI